jgi:hypothetical protein
MAQEDQHQRPAAQLGEVQRRTVGSEEREVGNGIASVHRHGEFLFGLSILTKIGPDAREAAPAVKGFLNDADPEIREAAILAMERITAAKNE